MHGKWVRDAEPAIAFSANTPPTNDIAVLPNLPETAC